MSFRHVVSTTLALALILMALTSCQAQDPVKDIRAKLEEINGKLEQAVLAGDYETQLIFFADDVIIDHPLEPPVKGHDALRAEFEKNRREGVKYHSFDGTIEDLWICGDKIYQRGTWGLSVTSNAQRQPVASYGSFFQIWKKEGADLYRIEYLIFTLDYNPYDGSR